MHKALLALVVSLGVAHTAATAVESRPAPEEGADAPAAETVRYPADFFAPYRPVTARDMVDQVPGFRIDNGDRSRGFGGAAGNVLIDGERPSSKQDTVSEILARIPADRVAAVELIRGNTGRYDAAGQTRLVNVVLDAQRRSWTWEATVEQDTDSGPPTPGASLSLVDRTGSTRWGAGIAANTVFVGGTAVERLFVDGEVLERRDESDRFRRASIRINANSETRMDRALLRFNGEDDELEYELGGDIEWPLTRTWQAKLIGLHRGETEDERQRQLFRIDPAPPELRRIALGESTETESIGRLELDWPVAPTQLF
jgi:hypothetical protein